MARKDKPYRVYRGGRARAPVEEALPREERRWAPHEGDGRYVGPAPGRRKGRRARRVLLTLLLVGLLLVLVWALLGFLALRRGVEEANKRLPAGTERALAPHEGLLLSTPANLLVLGADDGARGREGRGRADAVMLVHSDPAENRVARLSIPRDLRVEIPGRGTDKINASYAYGGPALAARTVERVTGLQVHHVAVVDFASFATVIDALDGITVDVRKPILSNRFDCPYATPARCSRWPGWRFRAGPQEMSGRRALVYARIRENRIDANESDITRGRRQQQVLQAIQDEATSLRTFLRLPLVGDELVEPLATDLSAGQLLQLAWIEKRTPKDGKLRCNLGGEEVLSGGSFYIQGTEENVSVIAMVTGESAPQPPPPGSGPFGPGCFVGK